MNDGLVSLLIGTKRKSPLRSVKEKWYYDSRAWNVVVSFTTLRLRETKYEWKGSAIISITSNAQHIYIIEYTGEYSLDNRLTNTLHVSVTTPSGFKMLTLGKFIFGPHKNMVLCGDTHFLVYNPGLSQIEMYDLPTILPQDDRILGYNWFHPIDHFIDMGVTQDGMVVVTTTMYIDYFDLDGEWLGRYSNSDYYKKSHIDSRGRLFTVKGKNSSTYIEVEYPQTYKSMLQLDDKRAYAHHIIASRVYNSMDVGHWSYKLAVINNVVFVSTYADKHTSLTYFVYNDLEKVFTKKLSFSIEIMTTGHKCLFLVSGGGTTLTTITLRDLEVE
jgi:hypothetical protein